MNRRYLSSPRTLAASIAVVLICLGRASASAQDTGHPPSAPPSTQLMIRGLDGKSMTFAPDQIAAMPHKSVTVYNHHSNDDETYSGVLLSDLLAKVGVPLGESVHGKLFLIGVVAEGTDHYGVLYALAEIDPSIHAGDVIVADSINGQKLGKDGFFKVVSTEERRPARWVRNLTSITVIEVKP